MRLFRVILGSSVVETDGQSVPAVSHVAFVVAAHESEIPEVLAADPTIRAEGMADVVPEIAEEIPTTLPVWTVKLGPRTAPAHIFVAVPSPSREEVPRLLAERFVSNPGVLSWIARQWFAVSPTPIKIDRSGVW